MKERVWKRYKLKLLACEALPGNKEMTEDKMVGCITDSMDLSLNRLRELVRDREADRNVVHGVTESQTQLRNRTELN